jgi:quinoprotein glucose dehydrogenase
MVNGKEYVAIAAGGGGKNATKSGDSIVAYSLPDEDEAKKTESAKKDADGWIQLFDGKTLNGWVRMNGVHRFDVENGAIVGRTVQGSPNSFLCTTSEFDDFELELETYIDPIMNSGVQIRTKVRPITVPGPISIGGAGRINGPQVEIRRSYRGLPANGMLYGEALSTGWFTSDERIAAGHPYSINDSWNKMRIVAKGPRIQTWVNDHQVEDLTLDELYKIYKKGFIGLQVHGIVDREVALPQHAGLGITTRQPLTVKFRNIRIRSLKD